MEIKNKFNIGDTIWFLKGYKAFSEPVTLIHILHQDNNTSISYWTKTFSCDMREENVYATKQELLDSL